MSEHRIKVVKEECIGCGLCVKDCVAHNIVIRNHKADICTNDCIMCGHCVAVCPKGAVKISGFKSKPVPKGQDIRLNPDEVLDVIRFRRTIRQFQDKAVSKEIVQQILEAGEMTHTAKNMQDVSYVVLDKEKAEFERLAVSFFRKVKPLAGLFIPLARKNKIDDNFFFFHAPLVIVVVSKSNINGILAAQNMEFVAEANGLGVLFSGFFTMAANASPRLKRALGIPKGKKAATTLVLGYPKVKYRRSVQREKPDVKYL